jgi:hypothetical protein
LEEGNFSDNCSKLSQAANDQMEAELSEVDLLVTLNMVANTATGPDGIFHSIA